MVKKTRAILCLLCICLLVSCGEKSTARRFSDADVSFVPTVYYANDGRIQFLYDRDTDMLSTANGSDMVALYTGGDYSLVITYTEGQIKRADADAAVKAEFSAGQYMSLSPKTEKANMAGHTFRRADITAADGATGAVYYGNTETGFAEIYYIISSDAPDTTQAHIEEILSTLQFGEFDANAAETENVKIYVDEGNTKS